MEIELRKHRNGAYVLEVRTADSTQEIDVSAVIGEVFVEKLHELQDRIKLEEKYRNWVVETAQKNQSALSSALARYMAAVERLKQTNESIIRLIETWRDQKDLRPLVKKAEDLVAQNQHFVQNDPFLKMIQELEKK